MTPLIDAIRSALEDCEDTDAIGDRDVIDAVCHELTVHASKRLVSGALIHWSVAACLGERAREGDTARVLRELADDLEVGGEFPPEGQQTLEGVA